MKKFINVSLHCNSILTRIHLLFISKITIMTTPLIGVQVTNNDTIDLLKPTLNVHESHHGRTAEIIMH